MVKKYECFHCGEFGAYESSSLKNIIVHKCFDLLEEVGYIENGNYFSNKKQIKKNKLFIKVNNIEYQALKPSFDNEYPSSIKKEDQIKDNFILIKEDKNILFWIRVKNNELIDNSIIFRTEIDDDKIAYIIKELYKNNMLLPNEVSYKLNLTDTPF